MGMYAITKHRTRPNGLVRGFGSAVQAPAKALAGAPTGTK